MEVVFIYLSVLTTLKKSVLHVHVHDRSRERLAQKVHSIKNAKRHMHVRSVVRLMRLHGKPVFSVNAMKKAAQIKMGDTDLTSHQKVNAARHTTRTLEPTTAVAVDEFRLKTNLEVKFLKNITA